MTKDELANEIAQKTGIPKVQVVKIVEAFMVTVQDSMSKNNDIFLRGFGTFLVKKRKQKTARNISKNTSVIVPEHNIPAFKPSKEFVTAVKTKKK
jgi:DNA-binding protein HU-beta